MDYAVALDAARAAFAGAADPQIVRVARLVFARLGLPVCEPALDLAGMMRAVSGLDWETGGAGFATAEIVGPAGIARGDGVWIGATRIAPGAAYPVHHHSPEEIYLFLAAGEFFDGDRWHRGDAGACFYNPPDRPHALRAGAVPLLALWFLPLGHDPVHPERSRGMPRDVSRLRSTRTEGLT